MCLSINSPQENELVYVPIPQPKLGNRIKETRKAKKLSQKQLGEQISVSHQTIATWEHGIRAPIEANLIRLAKALDKPDDFFFDPTPKKKVTLSTFGENLRIYRKKYGVTQIQLSEKTGIPLVTIKAYEDSSSGLFVTEANLEKLTGFFKTSREELLGSSDTAETLQHGLRENHIREIIEATEKLNLIGLQKAAERISEIAMHRRYQK